MEKQSLAGQRRVHFAVRMQFVGGPPKRPCYSTQTARGSDLALRREIIEAHGGRISQAYSEGAYREGGGARVMVCFPR